MKKLFIILSVMTSINSTFAIRDSNEIIAKFICGEVKVVQLVAGHAFGPKYELIHKNGVRTKLERSIYSMGPYNSENERWFFDEETLQLFDEENLPGLDCKPSQLRF